MAFPKKYLLAVLLVLSLSSTSFSQKFDKLALTPPMGWNSWNKFACDINENIIRQAADAMAESGMKDAGYQYIVIDDCWQGQRDSLGVIHPDPKRFPSGIKALADYVHSKGLKFGIYSDAGDMTCGGHPGSRGHEYQDALTYANWGVDYLKYDWCNTGEMNPAEAYKTMRNALYAAKRPIVFSICEWGNAKPWMWAQEVGHLWRTTGDIYNCYKCEINHGTWYTFGWLKILEKQKDLRVFAGPGHWNDPDMLEVGNGMKVNEDKAHFSLWCMLAAPLITGNDLRSMSQQTKDILTNKEVIAIDQDSLGVQGYKFIDYEDVQVWVKPLKNHELAFCFFNPQDKAAGIEFCWSDYTINDSHSNTYIRLADKEYSVRDLWAKKNLGTTKESLKLSIPSRDVVMVRLSR